MSQAAAQKPDIPGAECCIPAGPNGLTPAGQIRNLLGQSLQPMDHLIFVSGFLDRWLRRYGSLHPLLADWRRQLSDQPNTPQITCVTWDNRRRLRQLLAQAGQAGQRVALIGHSYGADSAAWEVARGQSVDLLITIDPVSRWKPDWTRVRHYAGSWINLAAVDARRAQRMLPHWNNWLALLGGLWRDLPQDHASFHARVDMLHGPAVRVVLPDPVRWLTSPKR